MTWLIKIEVEDLADAEYILEHLQTQNPIVDSELEQFDDE